MHYRYITQTVQMHYRYTLGTIQIHYSYIDALFYCITAHVVSFTNIMTSLVQRLCSNNKYKENYQTLGHMISWCLVLSHLDRVGPNKN